MAPRQKPSVSEKTRKLYRQLLSDCRRTASSDPIPNRHPWHCELAVNELMDLAATRQHIAATNHAPSSEVRLLTGTFPERVYGYEVNRPIDEFVDKGGKLKILVWNETIDGACGTLTTLLRNPNVEVRLSRTRRLHDSIRHFLVIDRIAYRVEAPHKCLHGEEWSDFEPEIPARICFNDETGAAKLVTFFDDIWARCFKVDQH